MCMETEMQREEHSVLERPPQPWALQLALHLAEGHAFSFRVSGIHHSSLTMGSQLNWQGLEWPLCSTSLMPSSTAPSMVSRPIMKYMTFRATLQVNGC
jgi:hypothetical protein